MYDLRALSRRHVWIALGLAWSIGSTLFGANTNAVAIKNLLTGLKNPRGVAIRPGGNGDAYEVFAVESGAGRVVKIRSDKPEKRVDVVSGFSTRPANDDNYASTGMYTLYFLDHLRLVLAGGEDDGTPFVRLYELPEPESPLAADQHKQEANVPVTGTEPKFDGHIFRSIARTQLNDRVGDFLLITAQTDGESTRLVYVPVRSGTLGDVVPAQIKNISPDFQIGGLTVGSNGYVTVAVNALPGSAQTSSLAFFSPLDRRIVMLVRTELLRIVALAYSPKTGNLFVANSPERDVDSAGIYRIDSTSQAGAGGCTATKIAEVRNATALAFAPDGVLYATAKGDAKNESDGVLLKLTGSL